ncbi:gallidermin/nisin family lantibiotic [Paenibacillus polymyxa]|uniref:gallidermin/nisin family lantibiotic n=1 Tax=Paenibacillus polymyxa TaxID=1406 RepID=UPI000A4C8EAD|nr:gallidermin/nisin family lantibiotic [Paenibacillus polymyxa]MCH6187884.1 gallidermin/nisin family lantibiotic [Paenibacillus polymyxa]MDY8092544.1 gallidermin/nisin family lantibiotic [Paenibacillus polymyxa]WRL57358.1 gallidermin/nisin family lantibiotic [Paenibacillus polymyxa]
MAENLFDLDVQVNKSQGSVEPKIWSIWNCSIGCGGGNTSKTCVETCSPCFSNLGTLC